jgi:imidazolonepropionase-like amidohydrolase
MPEPAKGITLSYAENWKMMRALRWIFGTVAFLLIAAYVLVLWPLRDPHPAVQPAEGIIAIRDVTVFPSPTDPRVDHATILLRDGRIAEIGPGVAVPPEARILSCAGCTAMAGFWNLHVHFTEPKWTFAAWKPAATLNAQLADMLTSRGFSTVADLGSDPRVSVSLRRRIESGELLGPKIYLAASALYPPKGIPYYLQDTLPRYMRRMVPQPSTPAQAARIEERNIRIGADVLKLFTGSYVARGRVLPMPVPIAQAAVDVAHRHGQLVFAHESNLAGARAAIESGVDILAHAADTTNGIDAAFLRGIIDRRMSMIPTLKMFAVTVGTHPSYIDPIYAEVRQFHALGGQLLFGTDVGYMTDYSTEGEFQALTRCGLSPLEILAMLTTSPAGRFGLQGQRGEIKPGQAADLVLLDGDPTKDIAAFSKVHYTLRNGRVLYAEH